MSDTGYVYLIHFARPISSHHTSQHYARWELWPGEREKQHRQGRGARLTQVAVERNIPFAVILRIPGDRRAERKLKNTKNLRAVCPICHAAYQRQRREEVRARRAAQRTMQAMFTYVQAVYCTCVIIRFMLSAHNFRRAV